MQTSTNRGLENATLVLLGVWAVPTAVVGFIEVVNAIQLWQSAHRESPAEPLLGRLPLVGELSLLGFLAMIMALNALLPALILGVIVIVRKQRSVLTALVFAGLVIAAPIAVLTLSEARNGGDGIDGYQSFWSWATFGGLANPVITTLLIVAAMALLRERQTLRTTAPPITPPVAAPVRTPA